MSFDTLRVLCRRNYLPVGGLNVLKVIRVLRVVQLDLVLLVLTIIIGNATCSKKVHTK